jgi:hypothetical protein
MANNITRHDFFEWMASNRLKSWFIAPAMILALGFFVLEHVNGRNEFADFRVYYDAATALQNGDQVYHKAFGVSSGFYKYSPVATLPFWLLTPLSYPIAAGIYYFIVAAVLVMFFLLVVYVHADKLPSEGTHRGMLLTLVIGLVYGADHIERELHLGNVNVILMTMSLFVFAYWQKQRPALAGIVLGAIILFKPHFVILLPYAVLKRQWKSLWYMVATWAVAFLILIPWVGWSHNLALYTEWFEAMGAHNVQLENSPNTVYGLVNAYVFGGTLGAFGVLILLALVGLLFYALVHRLSVVTHSREVDSVEFALLLALIPTLSHTDTEHFMFTFPCVLYVVYMLLHHQVHRFRVLIIVLMALAFVPYCLNSPDLVGKKVRYLFDEAGGLGLANLLIIACTVLVKWQQPLSMRATPLPEAHRV